MSDQPSFGPYVAMKDDEVRAQAKIIAEKLKRETTTVGNPTVVMTGGQPGSGKSSSIVAGAMKELGPDNTVLIDADLLRERIPRIKERMTGGRDSLPEQAREDAARVANALSTELKTSGRNLIIDGTMGDKSRVLAKIQELKEANLRVEVRGTAVYEDLSRASTFARRERHFIQTREPIPGESSFVQTGFGRRVPPERHDKVARGYVQTIDAIQSSPQLGVSRIAVYDREGTLKVDLRNDGTRYVAQPVPQRKETAAAQAQTGKALPPLKLTDAARFIENTQRNAKPEDLAATVRTYVTTERAMEKRFAPAKDFAEVRALKDAALDRASANQAARNELLADPNRRMGDELAGRAWRDNPAVAPQLYPQYKETMRKADELVQSSVTAAQRSGLQQPQKLQEVRAMVVERLGSDIARGIPPQQNLRKGTAPIRVATPQPPSVVKPPTIGPRRG